MGKNKRQLRTEMRLVRPPRLEGKAKNAMMNPVRKSKGTVKRVVAQKRQARFTAQQSKSYQKPTRRSK